MAIQHSKNFKSPLCFAQRHTHTRANLFWKILANLPSNGKKRSTSPFERQFYRQFIWQPVKLDNIWAPRGEC